MLENLTKKFQYQRHNFKAKVDRSAKNNPNENMSRTYQTLISFKVTIVGYLL